jgi:hypothetical protein
MVPVVGRFFKKQKKIHGKLKHVHSGARFGKVQVNTFVKGRVRIPIRI